MGSTVPHPRIKGAAFREFLIWTEKQNGDGFLASAVERLPADVRAQLDPSRPALGTLPSTWYDAGLVHQLLDSMTTGLSPADKSKMARDGSRAVIAVTLSGLDKRLIGAFVTPSVYARFADKLWHSYYDDGEFVVQISADGKRADCSVRDWGGHHSVTCDMNIEAASAIYEAIGQKRVATERTACVDRGDALCHFVTTWE